MWEKQIPYRNYLSNITLENLEKFLFSKGFTKDIKGTLNLYSNKECKKCDLIILEKEGMNDECKLHEFISHLTYVFDLSYEEIYAYILGDIKKKLDIFDICRTLDDLNKALVLASIFHNGIKDKGGNNYILHPLKVMDNLKVKEEKCRIVAILHDILEDTIITISDLRELGFSEDIIDALDCLSRRENETYKEFIKRVGTNDIAIYVKLADLQNNLDISRIPNPTEQDHKRMIKYKKYCGYLLSLIDRP